MEFRTLHAALVVLVATTSPGAADSRFCIVPVKDGQPTAADLGDTWRIHAVTFRIPGLPALVFAGLNRGGRWTITNRRLVRYEGPFPHFADYERGSWVVEPWSSRVVAVTFDGGASVLESGSDHFDRIDERRVRGPYLLPRRKVTVVTDLNSLPFVVMEDRSLKPWVSPEWLASHDIRGIQAFYDSPFLSATIVHSGNARLNVLGDNGAWQEVAKLDVRDFGTVFDAPTSGASIFLGSKSVVAIRKRGLGDSAHFSGELLFAGDGADQRAKPSSLFGRLLTYDRGSDGQMRWRHLGNTAFEDIPGGAIPVPYPKIAPYGNIRDLPLLRRTLIDSGDGLFLYDGSAIVPVPDKRSRPDRFIGRRCRPAFDWQDPAHDIDGSFRADTGRWIEASVAATAHPWPGWARRLAGSQGCAPLDRRRPIRPRWRLARNVHSRDRHHRDFHIQVRCRRQCRVGRNGVERPIRLVPHRRLGATGRRVL